MVVLIWTTIRGDKISAVDLSQVIMLNSYTSKKENVLTQEDIRWQEERRQRKVRKLNFEVRIGKVVEWLMALVLKTSDVRASVGSNPTFSV